jgi:hypothetical protein
MKKLKLKMDELSGSELLSKEQLKNVMGGLVPGSTKFCCTASVTCLLDDGTTDTKDCNCAGVTYCDCNSTATSVNCNCDNISVTITCPS